MNRNYIPHNPKAKAKKILLSFFKDIRPQKLPQASELTIGALTKKYVSKDEMGPEEIRLQKILIRNSGLFDDKFYLAQNKDVARSGMDALDHYVSYGGFEGRNPSARFDAQYYLASNPDVREMYANPLLHYLAVGREQGRKIKPSRQIKRQSSGDRVDIINVNFYDWDGVTLFKGGAERYVYDLACLLQKKGFRPRILQNANEPFEKIYRGIEVVGVKTGAETIRGMSKVYNKVCTDARLVIASPAELACELNGVRCLGINHGIYWDTINSKIFTNRTRDYDEVFDSLRAAEKTVCVDTNFINWVRTYDYTFGEKLQYVPNYYDANNFRGREKEFTKNLVFCYPRRLYDARGIHITLDAFDHLLGKHDNITLSLVGQTNDKMIQNKIKKLQIKYGDKVTLAEYPMEEMYKAYDSSHVVMIPTRYSEGTSLSCIEGMATNNAVIVTDVGGLPNLILDKYNGLIISPTADSLIEAAESLINDRDKVKSLADHGLDVVRSSFEKSNWDSSWSKIIDGVLR